MPLVLDGTNGVSGVDGTASNPAIEGTDSNTGIFYPAADTVAIGTGGTERLRVDSAGNAGLGVTPSAWGSYNGALDLKGGGALGAFNSSTALFNNSFYNGSNFIYKATTGAAFYQMAGNAHQWWNAPSGTAGSAITFTQAMTLDASGRLLVGTTTAPNSTDIKTFINSSGGGFVGFAANGTAGGAIGCPTTSILAFYTAAGTLGSETYSERARITSGGYFKASNSGAYYGATNSYHELRNSQAGESVVAVTHSGTNPYGQYLDFVGADPNNATNWVFGAYTTSAGVWIYRIYSNGTVAARSDVKWKKNIETARNGYAEDLAKLRVVKYNWYNHEDGAPKELGLIAQEVEQVFPGLVITDEQTRDEVKTREVPAVLDEEGNEVEPARTEEYTEKVGTGEYSKSIKFSVLPIMLLKAVQEQQAMIQELKAEIAALKGNA